MADLNNSSRHFDRVGAFYFGANFFTMRSHNAAIRQVAIANKTIRCTGM